jgi:Tfp pilus assembly protein PilX
MIGSHAGFPMGKRHLNHGAALLLGLLLLTALTLLGVAAGSDAVLQSQMAQNLENQNHSRQASEFALRWGEAWLLGLESTGRPTPCTEDCRGGDVIRGLDSFPYPVEHTAASWWDAAAFEAGVDPQNGVRLSAGSGLYSTLPLWVIEEVHHQAIADADPELDIGYYRILAYGRGPFLRHLTISEAIVARPWGAGVTAAVFPPDVTLSQFCSGFEPQIPCGRLSWRLLR